MRLIAHPVLCNYYLTYRCNAKCGFCDIWERPSPYITLENAEKNLNDLKKLGVNIIDFTGGEPLLHRNIIDLISMAKELGFLTTITTNCLLYPKYASQLAGKVNMLHFSLDSPIREEHNESRGVKCFDFVIKSIDIAKNLGERPDILFTVQNHNIHHIKQVYEEFCLPHNLVLILNPIFEYKDVLAGNLSESSLKEISKWGRKKNIYLNEAFIKLRRDGGNHIDKPVCKAASSTIVISPENKLLLPCYHLGIEEIPIENNLYNLYKSKEVQQLFALEGSYKECEGCTINCYMEPSFAVETNKYWWKSLKSSINTTI